MAEILDADDICDICDCSHSRRQHVNGISVCCVCAHFGFSCSQFRLAFHASKLTGDVRPSKDELEKAINESGLV